MGCAPSSAAGSSSRVSHADDGEVQTGGAATSAPGAAVKHRQSATPAPGDMGNSVPTADGGTGDGTLKPRENGGALGIKGSSYNEMFLGLASVKQPPMTVLLLFPRADTQSESLERAAEAGHYEVNVARSPDAAFQLYLARRHSVVMVDTRPAAVASGFDPESFSRLLRSTQNSECTVVIAVRPAA